MNNPLLALQFKSRGLKCDNIGCDYRDAVPLNYRTIATTIDRPCPLCGASLLTKQDARTLVWMIRTVRTVNVIAFPFMLLVLPFNLFKKRRRYMGEMNGSGVLKLTSEQTKK